MSEIKPCPHCGSEARSRDYGRGRIGVQCTNPSCRAASMLSLPGEDAITAWNARAEAADLTASLNRASDACASVQKERDALRDFMEEAKRLLGQISKSDWASIEEMKGIGIELGPESTAFAREIDAFLSRYEGEVK